MNWAKPVRQYATDLGLGSTVPYHPILDGATVLTGKCQ